jgi:nucleoside-diphosphate-sugar epimerase
VAPELAVRKLGSRRSAHLDLCGYRAADRGRGCKVLLEDRVAMVTGVGAGIGRAIALRSAAEGAAVVGVDVDAERGAAAMADAGGDFLRGDVGDLGDIEAIVASVMERHGRVDVLVNNAGVTKSLGFFDVTETDWDRIYRVNARGLFFCMQAVARTMRDRGRGRIINIASIAGKGYRGTSNIAYAGPIQHQRQRRLPRGNPHRSLRTGRRRAGRAGGHRPSPGARASRPLHPSAALERT